MVTTRVYFLLPVFMFLVGVGFSHVAGAQEDRDCLYSGRYCLDSDYKPEVVAEPICFEILNETDRMINGSVVTFYEHLNDGDFIRHKSNFMLFSEARVREAERAVRRGEKSRDEIAHIRQSVEMCSSGPFYNRHLELKIKTMFPVFNCWFMPGQAQPLRIYMRQWEGTAQPWADCRVTYPKDPEW